MQENSSNEPQTEQPRPEEIQTDQVRPIDENSQESSLAAGSGLASEDIDHSSSRTENVVGEIDEKIIGDVVDPGSVDEPILSDTPHQGQQSPQNTIDGYQHMSEEQKEMSMVREAHLSARPDIANLPNEFEYSDEEGVQPTTRQHIGGRRTVGSGDDKISVEKRRWDESQPWSYSGTRGDWRNGERIPGDEARELYDDMLDPSSIDAFNAMKKDEQEAVARVRGRDTSEALAREKAVEEAYAEGLARGERLGEARSIINSRLEDLGLEVDEADQSFIDEVIDVFARLRADEKLDEPWGERSKHSWALGAIEILNQKIGGSEQDISRQRDLMFKLLGASTEEGKTWVNGWVGQEKPTAVVYKTAWPDVVIVKSPEKNTYYLERNGIFTQEPIYTSAFTGEEIKS